MTFHPRDQSTWGGLLSITHQQYGPRNRVEVATRIWGRLRNVVFCKILSEVEIISRMFHGSVKDLFHLGFWATVEASPEWMNLVLTSLAALPMYVVFWNPTVWNLWIYIVFVAFQKTARNRRMRVCYNPGAIQKTADHKMATFIMKHCETNIKPSTSLWT